MLFRSRDLEELLDILDLLRLVERKRRYESVPLSCGGTEWIVGLPLVRRATTAGGTRSVSSRLIRRREGNGRHQQWLLPILVHLCCSLIPPSFQHDPVEGLAKLAKFGEGV